MSTQIIQEERIQSAELFLDRLSPRHKAWGGLPEAWAFRGHGDASWSLIPSALRERNQLFTEGGHSTGLSTAWESSWLSEMYRLLEFANLADSVALALPDHTSARRALGSLYSRTLVPPKKDTSETNKFIAEYKDWPPPEVLGVLALAQHHGVKTRLLDWSRRPNVAAYFAAVAAIQAASNSGFLAVWSLRVELAAGAFPPEPPAKYPRVEVISPALADNSNMAAQGGFFTLDRSVTAPEGLDVTIANRATLLKLEYRHLAQPAFWKFLLPQKEAGQLLKLLSMEGIHAATLFPGFDGVARHLIERRLWQR